MSSKKSRPPRHRTVVGREPTRAHPQPEPYPETQETFNPADGLLADDAPGVLQPSRLAWSDDARGLFLYHGDCLEVMDTIAAKHPDGVFDLIFADPPYFLSNGGITCHAGQMVKVDKGGWDKSRGPALNHEFNTAWLERCQRLLKPHGSMFVSGTHHVIFSIGQLQRCEGMEFLSFRIENHAAMDDGPLRAYCLICRSHKLCSVDINAPHVRSSWVLSRWSQTLNPKHGRM